MSSIVKAVDTFIFVATTSTSVTLSGIGFEVLFILFFTGLVCAKTVTNKVSFEISMKNCDKQENYFERAEQTINTFDEL